MRGNSTFRFKLSLGSARRRELRVELVTRQMIKLSNVFVLGVGR